LGVVRYDQIEDESDDDLTIVQRHLDATGAGSTILVPVGHEGRCQGNVTLIRPRANPEWSAIERSTLLALGLDLGMLVARATDHRRERLMREHLRGESNDSGLLLAKAAHDLGNPLASAQLNLETALADIDDPDLEAVVGRAHRSVGRMQGIVDDLMLMARLSPDTKPEAEVFDLREVISASVDDIAAVAEHVTLQVDLGPVALLVNGSRIELGRVIDNLLGNAVKYTPPGGHVQVRAAMEGAPVVAIVDTGYGIPEDQLDAVFTEFFRSTHPPARSQPGTGLGLAIVTRILARHHASISVRSTLGRGSEFRVEFPALESV
jgi:signal transduction histidine kinase